ncbi:unnamed protein product [Peronospora belbahrii]|uniref:BZIP domain-containing protein n=1 Tax=Peronospora belbahrii TaxID=622444 RepID=A0ABN8CM55_9STRA|nr:unnamed protein product [Peronospora belbahrii]
MKSFFFSNEEHYFLNNVNVWRDTTAREKNKRKVAAYENARLKSRLAKQQEVAKKLEKILLTRAQEQPYPLGHKLDFQANAVDFQGLLQYLDDAYSQVNAVLVANGLAWKEMTQQDVQMREGVDGMYYEVFSNKNLDTPNTIIEYFSEELVAGNSSTDVCIKQVVRRYVEAERDIVVWVASIVPLDIAQELFGGFTSRHRSYAIIKRAKASTPQCQLPLLQLISQIMLDTQTGIVSDPKYVRALTDCLLNDAARNIKADQQLIENVLMDQVLRP